MTDEIQDLENEELIQEYRETVEFRVEESLQGQVSPKQINLRKALESEILERMDSIGGTDERTNDVYEYIRENPDCTYSAVLQSVGETGDTIDCIHYLRQTGEIYEPTENNLRVTEE